MRYAFARKPRKCPACGSERIADILFGMPAFSEELRANMEAGLIVLGGCCMELDDPSWECADCKIEFFRKGTGA